LTSSLNITEFYIIYNKIQQGGIRTLNKIVGILGGFYFTGIFIYLFLNAVIPLTRNSGWHTWVDVVAVCFYLSGLLFLLRLHY